MHKFQSPIARRRYNAACEWVAGEADRLKATPSQCALHANENERHSQFAIAAAWYGQASIRCIGFVHSSRFDRQRDQCLAELDAQSIADEAKRRERAGACK